VIAAAAQLSAPEFGLRGASCAAADALPETVKLRSSNQSNTLLVTTYQIQIFPSAFNMQNQAHCPNAYAENGKFILTELK